MKNKIKKFFNKINTNESGQGMIEYILVLVIVVALIAMFKDQITSQVQGAIESLGGNIGGILNN